MATAATSSFVTMSPSSTTTQQQQKPAQRKKKAARACVHCQKAHLTCDDSRPCQRCIKRDLASTCTDGARKKAKYLQDTEDSMSYASLSTTTTINTNATTPAATPQFFNDANQLLDTAQLVGLENLNYGFGSTATNLEYSVLSNMLGSPQFLDSASSTPNLQSLNLNNMWNTSSPATTASQHNQQEQQHQQHTSSSSPKTLFHNNNNSPNLMNTGDPILFSPTQQQQQITQSPKQVVTSVKNRSPSSSSTVSTLSSYNRATKPFSYADGYHYLISYVKQKMGREELMRISRALALFRPSVLASMMNLTEDDLIFTEKCLQRTLMEYEKLITYSGTPTCLWRRTGEIIHVGKEFSLLTQWSRDALLGKKTYIYELMSNPSAVEYWEKYAIHAFDNTDSAVYSSCILLSPTKRVVPCTFCFTIKRDIFDLPSVIVGNVS
ncbi:hypothetical protein K501DRAFT_225159, partial [Backusella circina FSU 941]